MVHHTPTRSYSGSYHTYASITKNLVVPVTGTYRTLSTWGQPSQNWLGVTSIVTHSFIHITKPPHHHYHIIIIIFFLFLFDANVHPRPASSSEFFQNHCAQNADLRTATRRQVTSAESLTRYFHLTKSTIYCLLVLYHILVATPPNCFPHSLPAAFTDDNT